MAAQDTPNTNEAAPQAPADSSEVTSSATSAAQVQRALVNQGDTLRASWKFSLDAIRNNISHMGTEAKDLLVWSFNWCIDSAHPQHFTDFCERIGYAENTIYKIYSGKYRHPETNRLMDAPEKLVKALRDFRRIEVQRAKLGRKQFVMTPTAKRFFWACDQARKSNTPVIVYGASQVGKTEAARQYCLENNHGKSILVELEAVNGLKGLLQAVAAKIGVSPHANTPDLIGRIKKALKPDMVLILDEVHLLANVYRRGSFFACMEEIRRIYDATQCGIVMTFTLLQYGKIEGERKRELEQVFRRGVHRVNLGDCPSQADVRAICEAHGLPWAGRNDEITVAKGLIDKPLPVLRQLAREQGLKAIIERIRLGNDIAADADRDQVTWEDFLRAHYAVEKNAQMPESGW